MVVDLYGFIFILGNNNFDIFIDFWHSRLLNWLSHFARLAILHLSNHFQSVNLIVSRERLKANQSLIGRQKYRLLTIHFETWRRKRLSRAENDLETFKVSLALVKRSRDDPYVLICVLLPGCTLLFFFFGAVER